MRVQLVNNPSGPGCRHVHITDLAGKVLEVLTEDDFDQDEDDLDSKLKRRVRFLVRRYKQANPGATRAQIRTFIEGQDV